MTRALSPSEKYIAEGRYQLRKYEKYCERQGLDPTFPMAPKQLADYLDDVERPGSNLKSTMVSQLSRVAEKSKEWSRMMRSDPAVKKAIWKGKITHQQVKSARIRLASEKKPESERKRKLLPPVLATMCKRRPLVTQKWTVRHLPSKY